MPSICAEKKVNSKVIETINKSNLSKNTGIDTIFIKDSSGYIAFIKKNKIICLGMFLNEIEEKYGEYYLVKLLDKINDIYSKIKPSLNLFICLVDDRLEKGGFEITDYMDVFISKQNILNSMTEFEEKFIDKINYFIDKIERKFEKKAELILTNKSFISVDHIINKNYIQITNGLLSQLFATILNSSNWTSKVDYLVESIYRSYRGNHSSSNLNFYVDKSNHETKIYVNSFFTKKAGGKINVYSRC